MSFFLCDMLMTIPEIDTCDDILLLMIYDNEALELSNINFVGNSYVIAHY